MKTSTKVLMLGGGFLVIGAAAWLNTQLVMHGGQIGPAIGITGILVAVLFLVSHWTREREELNVRAAGGLKNTLLVVLGLILLADALACLFGYFEEVLISWVVLAIALCGAGVLYIIYRLCTVWLRRRATDRIVIGQIAAIVRQNLPLATGLALAGASERGVSGRILRRIARFMARGSSLSEAIAEGFPDCPSLPRSLIAAGERSGQLSLATEQAEQYLIERSLRDHGINVPFIPYGIVLLAFMFTVVSGIMVAVIPKFKEIFKDFGTELPRSTLVLMEISEFFAMSGLGALLGLGVVLLVPTLVYLNLRPRNPFSPTWTSRVADWVRWHVPARRLLEFNSGMAAVLRTMQMGVRSGMPLDMAARLAATVDVNTQLRPRVIEFADLLASGATARAAAEQTGLGRVTAVALAGGMRGGDLDAALRYAADYNEALSTRLSAVVRNLAWPLATIVLGIAVGSVVLALFQPLVVLIDSVAGY